MAQFTDTQTAEILATVTGQCEAIERTNAWAYNFGGSPRRGHAFHGLMARASEAVGAEVTDLPAADIQELVGLVLSVVQEYDRRNHIAPLV
jgi:hypothetical protein